MSPIPKDLDKYHRVATLYHDAKTGQSLRVIARRYLVSQMTISAWLRAVDRPPRAHGTHGPAERARLKRGRIATLKRLAREAVARVKHASRDAAR